MQIHRLFPKFIAYVLLGALSMAASAKEDSIILVIGDSLSAGYGMELAESWPRLLEIQLRDNGQRYQVVNSSITGDTTQGGLTRLPRLLEKHAPDWVIIELGGNDGLRGLSLDMTRSNIEQMIRMSQSAGAEVLLTGIMLPPNYGKTYADRFHGMYGELSGAHGTLLVPFFMEGVALVDGMMQADGIHPNAQAQPVLLANVWRVLGPELSESAESEN